MPLRRFYVGSAMDGAMCSSASIQNTAYSIGGTNSFTFNKTATVRFSYFINTGFTFNLNLGWHLGLYTGIDIKNLGFIERAYGETIKRRTYNIGMPLGIKIGNMGPGRSYLFLGAGIDAPFNYKQKQFTDRYQKAKFNEWFSNATPEFMPYVFTGYVRRKVSFKAQYYVNNFLNPDYSKANFIPNAGYNVHVFLLSIGFAVPLSKHKDIVEKHVADLNTATM